MQVARILSLQTTLSVERPELLDQSMKDILSLPDVSDMREGAYTFLGNSHVVQSVMGTEELPLDLIPHFQSSTP